MAYRNFLQLTSEVMRFLDDFKERAEVWAVQQTLNDALLEICQFHNWNFLIDRYDIGVSDAYSTGLVSATQGSNVLTLSGGTWNTSWFNKKILMTGTNAEKEVSTFSQVGGQWQANLRFPWNSASVASSAYVIYQDEYPVPMQNGRDILMLNPLLRYRLKKLDRYSAEDRTVFARFTFGVRPTHYSDGGADTEPTSPTYNQARLKLWPPVNTAQDLILLFYKTPTPMIQDTDTTVLPNEFEEILIKLALYRIRKSIGSPGWMDDHQDAMRSLLQMREKHSMQGSYDYSVQFSAYPYFDSYATDAALGSWPGAIR